MRVATVCARPAALTPDQIRQLRALHAGGEGVSALVATFGVSGLRSIGAVRDGDGVSINRVGARRATTRCAGLPA